MRTDKNHKETIFTKGGRSYLVPFLLVSSLFFMWGVANNMNDTLLAAFKRIMSMSDLQTSFIQFAFYGAYFCFALPTALTIRKYGYKRGIIVGLSLYAAGTMLFYPAGKTGSYAFFLIAIYIMASGCSVLETTANPYVMSMGSRETATRRLNVAQMFNPIGSLAGIVVSGRFILSELHSADSADRLNMGAEALKAVREHELSAITSTYLGLGVFLLFILSLMLAVRMPDGRDDSAEKSDVASSFRRLFANSAYRNGVIAQFFYVGAQIGVWSFTIRLVMKELGVNESGASTYFLCSIACFTAARFLFTYLMRYYVPARLMSVAAVFAILGCVGVLMGNGMTAVVSLVSVSFFMSLMFPTIYGIALEGVKEDVKIGASGLIMAILGGAVLTPLQGYVSDVCGANVSYAVPLACFVVVLIYGINASKTKTNS